MNCKDWNSARNFKEKTCPENTSTHSQEVARDWIMNYFPKPISNKLPRYCNTLFWPSNKVFLKDSFPLLIFWHSQVIDRTQTWLSSLCSFYVKSWKKTDSPQKEDQSISYATQQNLLSPPSSQKIQSYYFSKRQTCSPPWRHVLLCTFFFAQRWSTILAVWHWQSWMS